jgi:hypothetical protein
MTTLGSGAADDEGVRGGRALLAVAGRPTPVRLALTVVVLVAVPATLWLIWSLRDAPPVFECGAGVTKATEQELADWRRGAGTLLIAGTLLALAAACLAHAWHRECRDGSRTLTRRVRWVAIAVAVYAIAAALWNPLLAVIELPTVVPYLLGFAPPEAIVVAVLVATATLAWRGAPRLRAVRAVRALGWTTLLVVLPVVEAWIAFTGTDPTGCIAS